MSRSRRFVPAQIRSSTPPNGTASSAALAALYYGASGVLATGTAFLVVPVLGGIGLFAGIAVVLVAAFCADLLLDQR